MAIDNGSFKWPPEGSSGSSGVNSLNGQMGDITLIAGTNITITPGAGTLTIDAASGGITSINGDTTSAQVLAVGTAGVDFAIVDDLAGNHTFNLPDASASARGALTSADWTTFNNKFDLPSLTAGSVLFSDGSTIAQDNANFFWDNSLKALGIGTNAPTSKVTISGDILAQLSTTDAPAVASIFSATSNTTVDGSNTTLGINGVASGTIQLGATNDKVIGGMNFSITRGDGTDQGNLSAMTGANSLIFHNSDPAGSTDQVFGMSTLFFSTGGTVTDLYDFFSQRIPSGIGVVTNHYGIYINDDSTTPVKNWLSGITQMGGSSFSPAASTILDLQSTLGAFLPPRMDNTARDLLTPSEGMIIYSTTDVALEGYMGGVWTSLAGGGGGGTWTSTKWHSNDSEAISVLGTFPTIFGDSLVSGSYSIATTDISNTNTTDDSANLLIGTGSILDAASNHKSGDITIFPGQILGGSGNPGVVNINGGLTAGSGTGGAINLTAGNSSSGAGGNIALSTGTGSSRGVIQFVDGTEGTSGYVWTSTDGGGSGSWMPNSGGGANVFLSNLSSPTALNQDLIFDTGTQASVKTKDDATAATNSINLTTGNATGFGSGGVAISSGSADTDGTGPVSIFSAGASTTVPSGGISLASGAVVDAASGALSMISGDASGAGNTGGIALTTGTAQSGVSGDINIITGDTDTSQKSGDILLRPGNGGSPEIGRIRFDNGNSTVPGQVWTATDSIGSGDWMTSTAANTSLSNLNNPTSINQSLTFGAGDFSVLTPDVTTGVSGALSMLSGSGTSAATSTGVISIASGSLNQAAGTVTTGNVSIQTGAQIVANATAKSGDLNLATGATAVAGTTGDTSGNITIQTGGSSYQTGTVQINSGPGQVADTAFTGDVTIFTGPVTGTAQSGLLSLTSGGAETGTSGNVNIASGNTTTGTSGNVVVSIGAGTTKGKIQFKDGSEGIQGYVWTSTDVNGTGTWMPGGWYKKSFAYTDFSAASTSNDLQIISIPAGGVVTGGFIKTSVAFAGTGITTVSLSIGSTTQGPTSLGTLEGTNAVSGTNYTLTNLPNSTFVLWSADATAAEDARIYATADGLLNLLTAGQVEVWIKYDIIPNIP